MKISCKRSIFKNTLLVFLFGLFVVTCFGQNDLTSKLKERNFAILISDYRIKIAKECKGKGFDCSIAQCTKIIELNPNDGAAYFLRGNFAFFAKQTDEAIQDLIKSLELVSEHKETYNVLGLAYSEKGEFERAIKVYDKVINLAPKVSLYYSHRGNMYSQLGDLDKALADYNKAVELSSKDDYSYSSRAILYFKQGDFDKALADLNKAIELEPDHWRNYYIRGNFYLQQGKKAKADADFQKAMELKESEEKE